MFKLRFSENDIQRWADQYSYTANDGKLRDEVRPTVLTRGWLTKEEFLESLKIDLLRTLEGVEWPTASTLLHFCDERPYPILDYRALWSLGHAKAPHYTMDFWLEYLAYTRALAKRLKHDIRTIDRALWQYSKARQRSGS